MSEPTSPPGSGNAGPAALQAVARLLSAGSGDIRAALLAEARALIGVDAVALIAIEAGEETNQVVAADDAPARAALLERPAATLLVVPLAGTEEALLLGGRDFTESQVELARAFGTAAAAALGHGRAADAHAHQVERQAGLTRAAKALHEPLDLETLLTRICS